MSTHDDFDDIPPTDLDDVTNQDEEDVLFGWDKPVVDVPDDEGPA